MKARKTTRSISHYRKLQGFSLIEVLIAVLVVAFGVLGMAALQLKSLQYSHSGYQRTVASMIALDAGEQLWVKKIATVTEFDEDGNEIPKVFDNDFIAKFIKERHEAILPGLNVVITNPVGSNVYTITIGWSEKRFDGEDDNSFAYVIELYP